MKNQKGFTSIELLVSFIIVSAIVVGLFDVILNYRNTQQIASYEMTLQSYINEMTKMIQDDLVKRKITAATVTGKQATLTFDKATSENSKTSTLEIYQSDAACNTDCHIQYGPVGNTIRYPIPNIADLTIQSASISIQNQFLVVQILFDHPNFKGKKQIYITAPINYTA